MWAQEVYGIGARRSARLLNLSWSTLQYKSTKDRQEALRRRLREIAAIHVRYGYRRLTVLLRRQGWKVNAKRIYRLYDEENLKVRSVERKRIARRQRVPRPQATRPNQCWSADL
jgi:putative transposase